MSATVKVYGFKKYDINSDLMIQSKRQGTLEAIARAQGQPLMKTETEIDADQLDGDGFRRDSAQARN